MGGERKHIAEMSAKISREIFDAFGWQREPLCDVNFSCVKTEKHNHQTHPADVVFHYPDAYRGREIYVHFDLKSYAADSIKPHGVRKALRSLGLAVDCAAECEEYRQKWIHTDKPYDVIGALFIFNHDGALQNSFHQEILQKVKPSSLSLAQGRRLAVFAPERIRLLASVASDIFKSRGRGEVPPREQCCFLYPDLVRMRVNDKNHHTAATMESLLGPWIIFGYPSQSAGVLSYNYIFYYFGPCVEMEEFKFLIDYFFRSHLLGDYNKITIRYLAEKRDAPVLLRKAKESYARDFFLLQEFSKRLDRIGISGLEEIAISYNEYEIGMEA